MKFIENQEAKLYEAQVIIVGDQRIGEPSGFQASLFILPLLSLLLLLLMLLFVNFLLWKSVLINMWEVASFLFCM